jgi:hypothetical protein
VEIMIPLVAYERELELMRGLVVRTGRRHGLEAGEDYLIGTMIELPRACLRADEIAPSADFVSFGTNDLTQTAIGFSRDDIEGRILARYIDLKVFDRSPFETIDKEGVGQLVRMGRLAGQVGRPTLKLGVCGEHGGDPDSIDFFHHSGLDYVSCSPYRVPVGPRGRRAGRGPRVDGLTARVDRIRAWTPPAPSPRPSPPGAPHGRPSTSRRWPRAAGRPSGRSRSPTRRCAARCSATATGSCTASRSGASSTRPRSSSRPRATTTARG